MSGPDGTLRRDDLDPDPAAQFRRWYAEAEAAVEMPEAVALATADAEGRPSVRMVLAKGLDDRGFKFHTGHGSRKARELAANGRGALLFYWAALGRQVRVEGPVEQVPDDESEQYFRTRPRGGQIAAWASSQSEVIGSRDELDARVRSTSASSRARRFRSRRTGAATASSRRPGSSGSTATAASTIASATPAKMVGDGRSSASRRSTRTQPGVRPRHECVASPSTEGTWPLAWLRGSVDEPFHSRA